MASSSSSDLSTQKNQHLLADSSTFLENPMSRQGQYATGVRRESDQSTSSEQQRSNQLPSLGWKYGQLQDESHALNEKLNETIHNPATPTSANVQFATYQADGIVAPKLGNPPPIKGEVSKSWVPLPLRLWFWIPLVLFLLLAAIALEVALHFSKKNQGFPSSHATKAFDVLHYVYTLPPVAVAAIIAAAWAWTDLEIKRMQPYVDLVHGDAPPHRSLLLDYTRSNNAYVWVKAAFNRHYLVTLTTLMVLVTLTIQPLASALLVVRSTWIQLPDVTMRNLASVGLNQNLQFNDLTSFLTAAGYAGASILYTLPAPPFIKVPYTVANFQLPTSVTSNGTAFVNTTAVKSETGCQTVPVSMVQSSPGAWLNNATLNDCFIQWSVINSTSTLFGVDIPTCNAMEPPQFSPVVFWFFSYDPSARASATFCFPSISLWEVTAGVDIRTGNVTTVSEIRHFNQQSPFSSFSANVTGPPLDGRAYNGIRFNLTDPDQFALGRQNATQLQLPAAIYQAALDTPEGYQGSFDNDAFSALSDRVYSIYLALVALEVYFLPDPNEEPITVQVKTFVNRVWLSDVSVHLLTAALVILALFGTFVHIFHISDRRGLRLKHEIGTIASAVSIGAQTGVGEVLDGRYTENDMEEALRNKKFRIDPVTMKIIMEGELGYESAEIPTSPMARSRRKSVMMAILQGQRNRRDKDVLNPDRTQTPLSSPKSPKTPKSTKSVKLTGSPKTPKSLLAPATGEPEAP